MSLLSGAVTCELAARVVAEYAARGWLLATEESLTAGLLGATITTVPGASAVYRGGFITYATDVKASIGGVDAESLALHGAVASSTAEQMASNAAERCGAQVGLALTGVAGPDPQEGHPAGTVWLGWRSPDQVAARCLSLSGGRGEIREQAVAAALAQALELLPAGESTPNGALDG